MYATYKNFYASSKFHNNRTINTKVIQESIGITFMEGRVIAPIYSILCIVVSYEGIESTYNKMFLRQNRSEGILLSSAARMLLSLWLTIESKNRDKNCIYVNQMKNYFIWITNVRKQKRFSWDLVIYFRLYKKFWLGNPVLQSHEAWKFLCNLGNCNEV